MALQKDLGELIAAGVISQNTADSIHTYYKNKKGSSSNRLILAFGILGALLTGLGTILIIAHNWDELSRPIKTLFAFVPMLIGQAACIYSLVKEKSQVWRESSSGFLFFAAAAGIALVSQIYNIPGNLSTFLLTWMLISLPLVYVLNASATSLFYLTGITWFAHEANNGWTSDQSPYLFWLLFAGIVPYYVWLLKNKPQSNFTTFHNWGIPISLTSALFTIGKTEYELLWITYITLFSLFCILGNLKLFTNLKHRQGYKLIGQSGILALLLVLSFEEVWGDIFYYKTTVPAIFSAPEFIASAVLVVLASFFLLKSPFSGKKGFDIFEIVYLIFIPLFFVGLSTKEVFIAINVFVLVLGIYKILEGAKTDNLSNINFGLLIITALVACRFFDLNLSFVLRGSLFVALGISFFFANYFILKKRSTHEK